MVLYSTTVFFLQSLQLESELSKKPAPANPPISLLPKDVKKQGQAKHKKKSLGTEDGLGDKQSSTSTATGDSRLENAGKDKAKPDSKEGLKEKKVSGKESSNLKNSKESKNLNKDSSNVKNSRDSGEARDPVKNSSKAGLQGSMGKEKKVSDEELAAGERMACDFRKGDEAIHKQTADEESKVTMLEHSPSVRWVAAFFSLFLCCSPSGLSKTCCTYTQPLLFCC